jgi:hypothetical protein
MMLRRNVVEEGFISHQFEVYRVFVVFKRTLSYSSRFEETSMLMLYREGLVGVRLGGVRSSHMDSEEFTA